MRRRLAMPGSASSHNSTSHDSTNQDSTSCTATCTCISWRQPDRAGLRWRLVSSSHSKGQLSAAGMTCRRQEDVANGASGHGDLHGASVIGARFHHGAFFAWQDDQDFSRSDAFVLQQVRRVHCDQHLSSARGDRVPMCCSALARLGGVPRSLFRSGMSLSAGESLGWI